MKTQVLAALAVMFVAASTGGSALAQSAASANTSKYGIAVVDINYIFKNHQRFRSSIDGMKGDFQAVDSQLKAKQQAIVNAEKSKSQYNPGSPEFKQIDEKALKMKADLQVEVAQKRKSLVEKEAKIYFETYKEVEQAIAYYAKRQNIGLVLRFNGEEANPNNRESILGAINKAVHFQNQIDITPDVLSMLNSSTARTGGATSTN